MPKKRPTFIEGLGWRYEVEHSMLRRMQNHDYRDRWIYMVTLTTEGRKPLLGKLCYEVNKIENAIIEPTVLGQEVINCWQRIPEFYPDVKLLAFQLMPDHIHGLLFITKKQTAHLGQMINGFKVGCNRAYQRWSSSHEALPHDNGYVEPKKEKHPQHGLLFTPGYQETALFGKGQLDRMFRYIADNPRRLALKKENPDLLRVVRDLEIGGQKFAAIGNQWLIDRPVKLQVRCHNNTTPKNLQLIEKQKKYFLERGQSEYAVVVSPCISAGEKEIARAALDAKVPLIVLLENGFAPLYKPPGKYFDACCKGLLLMLAPWPYHMEKRKITRQQCLLLNDMAFSLSTEPWTQELEEKIKNADDKQSLDS